MNCVEIQTKLAEDLSCRFDSEVGEHLTDCPACTMVSQELLELEDLSRSLSGRFKVPANFQDQVINRFEKKKPVYRWRVGLGFACAASLGLVVFFAKPWEVSGAGETLQPLPIESVEAKPIVDDSGTSGYLEITVPMEGEEDLILKIPSVIEVHRTQFQEDFYISNVSH